mgnify:CR=1 FL=1
MTEANRAAAGSDDLLRDFRGGGLLRPLLITVAVHAVVILATSVPWLRAALGGGKADLTEEQRLDAAVKEATASLQAIAKEHGVRPQDLGSRFSAGAKPAAKAPGSASPGGAKPDAADKPAAPAAGAAPGGEWGASGQPPAGQQPSGQRPADAPKTDAPAAPPGPALPEVKDDVDLFK